MKLNMFKPFFLCLVKFEIYFNSYRFISFYLVLFSSGLFYHILTNLFRFIFLYFNSIFIFLFIIFIFLFIISNPFLKRSMQLFKIYNNKPSCCLLFFRFIISSTQKNVICKVNKRFKMKCESSDLHRRRLFEILGRPLPCLNG
jgi:hypothetical protein